MTITKDAAGISVWHPDPGQPIEDEWGDRVANSVFQRFANIADRNAKWLDPPPGALAQTVDYMLLWKWNGKTWEVVGTTPGTIVDVFGGVCPDGYLECTGQGVPTGTFLRDVLGVTATPNLAGRSTVGYGTMGGAVFWQQGQVHGTTATALPWHNHNGKTHAKWINHTHGMAHSHGGRFMGGKPGGWTVWTHASYIGGNETGDSNAGVGGSDTNLTTEVTLSIGEQVIDANGVDASISNYHPVMAVRKCIKL